MYKALSKILALGVLLLFAVQVSAQDKPLNGRKVTRYENGKKESVIHYRKGLKHGKAKYWFDTGEKKEKACYKADKLTGKYCKWYKTGQLNEQKEYENGMLNGWYSLWTSKGILLDKCHYVNDQHDGQCYNYHYTGQLNWEKTFVNDSLVTYSLQPLNEVARQWIYFDYLSTALGAEEKQQIDEFIIKAKAQADYPIRVQGYNDFEEGPNMSFDRTKAVHDYMISQGIPSERLTLMAYEAHRPLLIKQEAPQKERNKNKRVEIYLVSSLEF